MDHRLCETQWVSTAFLRPGQTAQSNMNECERTRERDAESKSNDWFNDCARIGKNAQKARAGFAKEALKVSCTGCTVPIDDV